MPLSLFVCSVRVSMFVWVNICVCHAQVYKQSSKIGNELEYIHSSLAINILLYIIDFDHHFYTNI
jgi:ssRNA-specific RNase YbeY (16S rRNA maturation enzyme)